MHLVEPAKINVLKFQALGVADVTCDMNALSDSDVALHFGNLL